MSAVVSSSPLSGKLAETAARVRERCASIQDTLDQWIDVGRDLDALGCAFIADQGQKTGRVPSLRKRKADQKPQGLRKRCIAHLETIVGQTGFDAREIGRALQLFALEKSAPWVSQLKSERKARELKMLAAWHWEGCKLTREGERSIKEVHKALADGGMSALRAKEIREVVSGIIGRVPKAKKNSARAAAKAFFDAIEGTEDQPAADRADVLSWLTVLLTESPLAADVLTEAVEAHLDAMTTAEAKGQAKVA